MKVLLAVLMLALATMAIPNASAGSPVGCTLGPMTPSGDTDCRAQVEECEAHTHIYDKEDALNVYEASCHDCGFRIGGGPFLQCDLFGPAASPAAAAAPDPVKTHCWTAEDGSGCSTTVAGTCTFHSGTMGDVPLASASCWTTTTGWCDVTVSPVQTPPVWCDGPRRASAGIGPEPSCQEGIAQTWCDATVGPCDLRVTPWTAWGDQSVVSHCRVGGGAGATCHTEVHTQDLTRPQHSCAW